MTSKDRPTDSEVFARCRRAISSKPWKGHQLSKSDKTIVLLASERVQSLIHEVSAERPSAKRMTSVRKALKEVHPRKDYSRAFAMVSTLADFGENLLEIERSKERVDHEQMGEILDLCTAFMHALV